MDQENKILWITSKAKNNQLEEFSHPRAQNSVISA